MEIIALAVKQSTAECVLSACLIFFIIDKVIEERMAKRKYKNEQVNQLLHIATGKFDNSITMAC